MDMTRLFMLIISEFPAPANGMPQATKEPLRGWWRGLAGAAWILVVLGSLVLEIMICTPAIKAMIRDNKTHQIYGIMQAGQKHGMQTMNQSLYQAYVNKWISREQALGRSTDPQELLQMLGEPVGVA